MKSINESNVNNPVTDFLNENSPWKVSGVKRVLTESVLCDTVSDAVLDSSDNEIYNADTNPKKKGKSK